VCVLTHPPSYIELYFKRIPVLLPFVSFELQFEIRLNDEVKRSLIATLMLTAIVAEISECNTVCRLQVLQVFMEIITTTRTQMKEEEKLFFRIATALLNP
jgi:hypothetical protein